MQQKRKASLHGETAAARPKVDEKKEEAWTHILTSARDNVHEDTFQITEKEVAIPSAVPWSVVKRTLHGGKQEGVDVIIVRNGKLSFTVIPTRGMGLGNVVMGGARLGWDSPIKEIVHPQFMNLESRGGLGFLEGFSEFMCRCGLEFAGAPGKDVFINNNGDKAEMMLTLHGKTANTPASEVYVMIDKSPPYRIRIRGKVEERVFFVPKLDLWSEFWTEIGSPTVHIDDTITNCSAGPQELQLVYHVNFGPPILQAGSKLVVAPKTVRPFNQHAAKSVDSYATYEGPTAGWIEQCYGMQLYDEQKQAKALIHNAKGDLGCMMKWATDTLPCFTQWKNTTAMEDGYVTGLEPGIGFPRHRSLERQDGRVPKLQPNESKHFSLAFDILVGAEAVTEQASKIQALQKEPPAVNPQPF